MIVLIMVMERKSVPVMNVIGFCAAFRNTEEIKNMDFAKIAIIIVHVTGKVLHKK